MKKLRGRFLTFPNILSLTRLFLLPLAVYLLENNLIYRLLVLLAYFAISDSLDGFLSRRFLKFNDYGRIIDHVVDKITIITLTYEMVKLRGVPQWVLYLLLLREIGTFIVSGYIFFVRGIPTTSNIFGKITGIIMAVTFIFYLFYWSYREILLYLTVVVAGFTSLNYARIYSAYIPVFSFLNHFGHSKKSRTASVSK